MSGRGPLAGLRVLEFVSIGPGPHCAMLLSDMGADVVRIDRPGGNGWPNPVVDRGRSVLEVDIRSDLGRGVSLDAADVADVLIEGSRPGVMERLGLGPDVLLERNPRLVYGRVTGWGQEGPLASAAGHDINYIALAGALAAIGRAGEPAVPPLNLVGDFGGGSMFLAFGILAALYERERSGRGQVVDAAIVDGVTSLMTMFSGMLPDRAISVERERNPLSGAAPFYRSYMCADGREISVGPVETRFHAELLERIGAPAEMLEQRDDPACWAAHSLHLAAIFRTRSAGEWCDLLEGTDACFSPVLPLGDVPSHPHMVARRSHVFEDGLLQPAPSPRLSRTPGQIGKGSRDGAATIASWRRAESGEDGNRPN
jgi:alpha-methylacyl-CoA racemase